MYIYIYTYFLTTLKKTSGTSRNVVLPLVFVMVAKNLIFKRIYIFSKMNENIHHICVCVVTGV